MFFNLDRDGSGTIDAEELAFMLRSLGQNPTEEEVHELIASVDDGDKDGKIQFREFLKLYTQGMDTKNVGRKEDVEDIFRAVDGITDAQAPVPSVLEKVKVMDMLHSAYELDVDVRGPRFNRSSSPVSYTHLTLPTTPYV